MAVDHGGQRSAGAQVAGHDTQPVGRTPQQFRGSTRGVGVRQPMEPIALNVPFLAPLRGEGIHRCGGGHGRMKRGVEACDGRRLGQRGADSGQHGERYRLVQWGQVGEGVQPLHDPIIDPDRSHEFRPAVDDSMPDGIDRAKALEDLRDS